ncbi:hypothetical protein GY45DRAFT_1337993 [Cubamyces sp. BRFM 1775]|nr:hypothetical protein GY45DRAFT_1337993 [Cubamyces sp. BRFM 1775]
MSQPSESLPQVAPASTNPRRPPALFNQPSADFILHTSDDVDFRVHSQILAQASPFFAAMVSLPQPAPQAPQDDAADPELERKATVEPRADVSEDSATLAALLHLVYPVPKTAMDDPAQMLPLVKAAKKYDFALPLQILCQWLIAAVPHQPILVWATACRTGLEAVARHAATQLSKQDALDLSSDPNVEAMAFVESLGPMDDFSAADYFRLKRFLRCKGEPIDGESLLLLSPTPGELEEKAPCDVPFAPFSTDIPSTDVLCWPASGEEAIEPLRAHKAVLSVHSAVLRASLAGYRDPVSSDRASDTSPDASSCRSLHFDEDEPLVSALLTVCYHGRASFNKSRPLAALTKLLRAAEKYDMADVAHWTRAAWDERVARSPLEAYYAAIADGFEEHAKGAVLTALERPWILTTVYLPVMESTSAPVYHRLLKFVDAHRLVVQTCLSPIIISLQARVQKKTSFGGVGESKTLAQRALCRLEAVSAIGALPRDSEFGSLDQLLPAITRDILPYIAQLGTADKIVIPDVAWRLLTVHTDIRRGRETIAL